MPTTHSVGRNRGGELTYFSWIDLLFNQAIMMRMGLNSFHDTQIIFVVKNKTITESYLKSTYSYRSRY